MKNRLKIITLLSLIGCMVQSSVPTSPIVHKSPLQKLSASFGFGSKETWQQKIADLVKHKDLQCDSLNAQAMQISGTFLVDPKTWQVLDGKDKQGQFNWKFLIEIKKTSENEYKLSILQTPKVSYFHVVHPGFIKNKESNTKQCDAASLSRNIAWLLEIFNPASPIYSE